MSQFICFPSEFNVNSARQDVGYDFKDYVKCSSLTGNQINASYVKVTGGSKMYYLHFPNPKTSKGLTAAATPTSARATLPAAPKADPAKLAPVVTTPNVRASPSSFFASLSSSGAA